MRRLRPATVRLATALAAGTLVLGGTLVTIAVAPSATASSSGAAGTIDQCVNGGVGATPEPCLNGSLPGSNTKYANWVNGDANGQKAHWREGDFLPYRADLTGLDAGSHELSISFDTVHGGKNAIDYLGSFDATETTSTTSNTFHANNNNPCFDLLGSVSGSGCTAPGTPVVAATTTATPTANFTNSNLASCDAADTASAFVGTQVAGAFSLFAPSTVTASLTGAHYTATQDVVSGSGQCTSTVLVDFTLTGTPPSGGWEVVLAWGGHVASQKDWGVGNSASAISGSPYHMALDSITQDGNTVTIGSQDRALSANAIFYTPTIVTAIENASNTVVSTAANPGSVAAGTVVHDTATFTADTFSPAIGGAVTYQRFTSNDCSGTAASAQTVNVGTGGSIPDSSPYTVGTSGSLSFNAVYNGDGQDLKTTSACEPLTIVPPTGISTTANPTSEVVGTSALNDSATLTGGNNPTGTIDFYLFDPTETCTTTITGSTVYRFHFQATVTGVGTYPTTGGPVPDKTGTWQWVAVYSGDSNNNLPSHSNCGDEPVTITKATPGFSTTAVPTTEVVGGSTGLNDSGTVTGGYNPGGTIKFYLFDPTETCTTTITGTTAYRFTYTATVTGDGTFFTTGGPTPDVSGTWQWVAIYSGDGNNNGATSGCTVEPVSITQQGPTLVTTPSPTEEVVGGSTRLNDTGTLSGGFSPAGTIKFYLFDPTETCTATITGSTVYRFTYTATVSGNGDYTTTGGPVPDKSGTWQWVALYSGDTNNSTASSGCTLEPVTIDKASPNIGTTANPTSETVGGVTGLNDSASLTGGYNPIGTVKFYLFDPTETCTTTITGSTAYRFTYTATVSGNGSYSTTGGPLPDKAGTWQWVALYSGDGNNNTATSGCTLEPVTIGKASPGIVTAANPAEHVVGSGTLNDSATLSSGYNPGGTIDFYLFDPTETCTATITGSTVYRFHFQATVSGNGSYPTTGGPTPDIAGTWQWVAIYSGDGNNNPVTSGCTQEPVTIDKASPDIGTSATPTSETVGGSTGLNDSASLTGGYNPIGSITFYLFDPTETCTTTITGSTAYRFTFTATVTGNGSYSTTGGPSPDVAGTWQWVALYSGDGNNNPATSGCTLEPVTIDKASPGVDTTPNPTEHVVGSGTLNDSATLSSGYNPTGTITFYLFDPTETCTTTITGSTVDRFSYTATVTGNGTYSTTGGPTPDVTGTWQWVALYSGDGNNNTATSGCTAEPVTIDKASPNIGTTADPTSETVGGAGLNDSASLTGGYNPTGSITFYLFDPTETCTTTITGSTAYRFTFAATVTGNGSYSTTGGPSPDVAGTWQWVALYSGDGNNNPATSGCTLEPVSVGTQPTILSTTASPTSETVGGSTGLNDTGTLSGGFNPTGTITFYLFDPTETCTTNITGSTVYRFTYQATVSGNGDYTTTGGPTPDTAGTWRWVALYSGDGNNDPASSGCTLEPVTINKASPGIVTAANPTSETVGGSTGLNDSATLSSGFNPTGTITFYLFDPTETCTTTITGSTAFRFSYSATVSGNGTYSTTGGPTPDTAGTWRWVALYSGDGNNNPASSGCTLEPVTIGKASPTLDTTPSFSAGTLGSTGALNDTGTISGGVTPTGTITFYLFDPNETCTTTITGSTAYRFTYSTSVSGNGDYTTTGGPTPDVAGTWEWVAFYSGDGNNDPATSGCGAEAVTLSPPSTNLVTTPNPSSEVVGGSTVLNDSATLSGGFNPTGTIKFYLFDPTETCTSTITGSTVYRFTYTATVSGNGTYSTTGGPAPNIAGTWQWVAIYSGDANNDPSTSGCGQEPVDIMPPPSVGLTQGFWHNKNGHARLDPDGNGDIDYGGIDVTYTIGINGTGLRYATVSTIAASDKILPPSNACGTPSSFNLSCSNLPGKLNVNTLNALASQTLAAEYNFAYITGFSSQTLGSIGCTVPASLTASPYSLSSSSTMAQVIAAANYLIGHAVSGGTTNQTNAGDMTGLLGGCVNMQ